MRIAVIGAGPAGLYFAALVKQQWPHWTVTVWERNTTMRSAGLGVVLSATAFENIERDDQQTHAELSAAAAWWSDIDIRYRDQVVTSHGHGLAAVDRTRLLRILRDRCGALKVDLRYGTPAPPVAELSVTHDVVAACDGVRSATRHTYADTFMPDLDERHCRYMWLGTDKVFKALTFIITEHSFGTVHAHAYPYDAAHSTCIVEISAASWHDAGLIQDHPDGVRWCEELLADHLDGHRLFPQRSRWQRFTTVRNRTWRHENVVLLGDAAHTTHFSIGSGTRLAMDDAAALTASLRRHADVPDALTAYEAERRPVITSAQRAAQASLEWFEQMGRHTQQEPGPFAANLLTRSRRPQPQQAVLS